MSKQSIGEIRCSVAWLQAREVTVVLIRFGHCAFTIYGINKLVRKCYYEQVVIVL